MQWLRLSVVVGWLVAGCLAMSAVARVEADESQARYFEQLRRRGLFSLAEGYALSRLAQPYLHLAQRTDLAVELSRTLTEHAGYVSDDQREEMWKRAIAVIEEERNRDPSNPRDLLLAVQVALVPAAQGDWLRVESELRPFDEPLSERARQACSVAIDLLRGLDRQLSPPPRDVSNVKGVEDGKSFDTRTQRRRVRFQLASSLRSRAALWPATSRERSTDLLEAEQTFRKLLGTPDDPLAAQARLGLAVCSRLKGEPERCRELLTALEKSEPGPTADVLDEIVGERARLLLEKRQGVDALTLIVQTRSQRKRLTGDLWLLQVRALASMRDAALQADNQELADQLREQAEVTLQRCEEQVGGFWSRRCQEAWASIQTAEKYGPKLDTVMQQARADFLAGRVDAALKGYAVAKQEAIASGQTDLAVDLGYTRASIRLRERQFEQAAADFLQLAHDFPEHTRAPAAHLNGAYCLGRLSDAEPTPAHRDSYAAALDQQIELFSTDATADDARFFKARFEEQQHQPTAALRLYLQISVDHAQGEEARAGAARCYEAMLVKMRERKLPTVELEQEAFETLSRFLQDADMTELEWTAPQAELAVHLAAVLLLANAPQFDRAERLLATVMANATRVAAETEPSARWQTLRRRAVGLRVVALAGNGQPLEAERLLKLLGTGSARELLTIIEQLAPFVADEDPHRRQPHVAIQLRAIERLTNQRETLSPAERERLDRCLARAYLAGGQEARSVELFRRMSDSAPKDVALQREIAGQLERVEDREGLTLAKLCWHRVELATKQGSPDWLAARLGVISTTEKMGQSDQAKKLLDLTKLLYPGLGGVELQARFMEMERRLGTGRSQPKSTR